MNRPARIGARTCVCIGTVLCLLALAACSEDPMEACMKRGLGGIADDGASRGEYIKARERVRLDCERRLN